MASQNQPRIQFRLSKSKDSDLVNVFSDIQNTTDEAKRLIRLGIEYEQTRHHCIVIRTTMRQKAYEQLVLC